MAMNIPPASHEVFDTIIEVFADLNAVLFELDSNTGKQHMLIISNPVQTINDTNIAYLLTNQYGEEFPLKLTFIPLGGEIKEVNVMDLNTIPRLVRSSIRDAYKNFSCIDILSAYEISEDPEDKSLQNELKKFEHYKEYKEFKKGLF